MWKQDEYSNGKGKEKYYFEFSFFFSLSRVRYVSARLLCNHNAMISSLPHRFHLGPFSFSYWAENMHTDIGPLMFSLIASF